MEAILANGKIYQDKKLSTMQAISSKNVIKIWKYLTNFRITNKKQSRIRRNTYLRKRKF
jgi:hypothetical protein